jgi:DUF4097 and DUF4098 domain-containing protein YvlB
MNLVNEQEIELNGIRTIHLSYENGSITVLKSNTSSLIMKEYMNQDKRSYFADIHTAGDTVNIESGERPLVLPLGIIEIKARIELYVPESFAENLDVRTRNGGITIDSVNGIIIAATSNGSIELNHVDGMVDASTSNGSVRIDSVIGNVNAKSSNGSIELSNIDGTVDARNSNGSIDVKSVNGNVSAHTSNGPITLNSIDGEVDARTSNGYGGIEIKSVNGNVFAESSNGEIELEDIIGTIDTNASNGSIECNLAEVTGNIKLKTSNGSIDLDIPRSLSFQFSARTTHNSVRTAFDDKLSHPVNDDRLYQGIISQGNNPSVEINLETRNGSINVDWID